MDHFLSSSPRSTRWIPTSRLLQLPARCARLPAPPRPTWPCTCFKRIRHSARKTTKMRKKCWSCPHSHWIIQLRSRPNWLNRLILLNQLLRLNQLIHFHHQLQAAWRLTPAACVTRSCILGCILRLTQGFTLRKNLWARKKVFHVKRQDVLLPQVCFYYAQRDWSWILDMSLQDNLRWNILWGSELRTSPVLEWSKHVRSSNGLLFKPWPEYQTLSRIFRS